MPNEYARSGFHSGETASGYFDESFGVFNGAFGGTSIKTSVMVDSLEITERLGEAINECVLSIHGNSVIQMFYEVAIYNGGYGVGVPIFRGVVTRYAVRTPNNQTTPIYDVTVSDQGWLLNCSLLVTKTYTNQGASTIVGDLLYTYGAGFTPGYLPSTLGTLIEITFENERLLDCLLRIAHVCDANLKIGHNRRVSIVPNGDTFDDEGNSIAIADSSTDIRDFRYTVDGSKIAYSVVHEGPSANTTATVAVGATTIPVDETVWFQTDIPAYRTARSGSNEIVYTSRSTTSGPGNLTGVGTITTAIPQGSPVTTKATVATGTTFATDLTTGGISGVAAAPVIFASGDSTIYEAIARAARDARIYASSLKGVTYTTTNAYVHPGSTISVVLTRFGGISESLTVQEVRTRAMRKIPTTGTFSLERFVVASQTRQVFSDVILALGWR